MAKVIDALVVTLGLDPSGYKQGAAQANAAQAQLKQSAQAGATTTTQATQTAGNAQAKLAKAQRERAREEAKRRKEKERADRRQSQEEQKHADATIDRIKSVGLAVAGAVLGFNTLKGALSAYVGATNQLANLGRVAPTIGIEVKALDKLGDAYKQVTSDKAQALADAQNDTAKLAQAQFSYAVHAPDETAKQLRNLRVDLFDENNKPREKEQIENDIARAIKSQTSDLQTQAGLARLVGMSESFIQLQLVKSSAERAKILKNSEATAKANKASADAAIAAEQARARLGSHLKAAGQQVGSAISGVEAPVENIISDALDSGDYWKGLLKLATGYRRRVTANTLAGNFQDAEKKNGLPAGSLGVIARQESNFNPGVQDSPAGARGLMQIMPKYYDTATYKVGKSPEADIAKAGEILGASYRRHLSEGYDEATAMKMAREDYNAGPTKAANVRSGKIDRHTGAPTAFMKQTLDYTSKTAGYQDAFNAAYSPSAGGGSGGDNPSTVNNTTHIEQLNVHTAATDGPGIAASLPDSLRRQSLVSQANSGLK